jgi:DNA-binding transcriptional MerR regulator
MTSDKAPDAFRTISEAADDLGLPQHVLRFWETRFSQIKPLKRGGGRRYYRPDDVEFLRGLKHLLHAERYTIKGVQKIIKEQGIKAVQTAWKNTAPVAVETPLTKPAFTPDAVPATQFVPLPASARARLEAALAELMDCRRQIASFRQA